MKLKVPATRRRYCERAARARWFVISKVRFLYGLPTYTLQIKNYCSSSIDHVSQSEKTHFKLFSCNRAVVKKFDHTGASCLTEYTSFPSPSFHQDPYQKASYEKCVSVAQSDILLTSDSTGCKNNSTLSLDVAGVLPLGT